MDTFVAVLMMERGRVSSLVVREFRAYIVVLVVISTPEKIMCQSCAGRAEVSTTHQNELFRVLIVRKIFELCLFVSTCVC